MTVSFEEFSPTHDFFDYTRTVAGNYGPVRFSVSEDDTAL